MEVFNDVLTKRLADNPDLINVLKERVIEKRKEVEERKKSRTTRYKEDKND